MGRFFNIDSPLMLNLSRIADLMLLNLLVIFMCLPIITIGPALTAMHYVLLKMVRNEDGYIFAPFFKSFKENFKQSTISGLIIIVFIVIFIVDLRIINESGLEFAHWLRAVLMAAGVIALMTCMYIFPLIARFKNTIFGTFKNALFMSILNLPKTLLMIVVCVIPILLVDFSPNMYPFIFLLGFSGTGYICAKLYSGTFKRFEPEAEDFPD